MDIYYKLPTDIQSKICFYFRHPNAQMIQDNKWHVKAIINHYPQIPTIENRLRYAFCIYARQRYCGGRSRKPCGCIWWEQHEVYCNDIEPEDLEFWDPAIKSTPLIQAIEKSNVCYELKQKINPYYCEVKAMIQEN